MIVSELSVMMRPLLGGCDGGLVMLLPLLRGECDS